MARARVDWSGPARRDLENLFDWIGETTGPAAAQGIVRRIRVATDLLSDFPSMGVARPDLDPLARALSINPWLVLYTIEGDDIVIQRVLDGRRDLPRLMGPA